MSGTGAGAPRAGAVIRGEVRGPDGRPVEGARVAFTSAPVPMPEIAAVTDAAGRFALTAPAPGEYTLAAHAEDASAGTGSVRVPSSQGEAKVLPRPAAHGTVDDHAEMSSDDPMPQSAPGAPPAEVRVVLTLGHEAGEKP